MVVGTGERAIRMAEALNNRRNMASDYAVF